MGVAGCFQVNDNKNFQVGPRRQGWIQALDIKMLMEKGPDIISLVSTEIISGPP